MEQVHRPNFGNRLQQIRNRVGAFAPAILLMAMASGAAWPAHASADTSCLVHFSPPGPQAGVSDAPSKSDCVSEFEAAYARAQSGDAKAQDDLARYFRFGIGTKTDLLAAKDWYMRAASGGRGFSLLSLARVNLALGDGEAAYENLQAAIEQDVPNAGRQLAFAHIDRKLGVHSDPDIALPILLQMARAGDPKASVPLLSRYNWKRLPSPAPEELVASVEQFGLSGDAKAAEAALLYISQHAEITQSSLMRRKALLGVPGLRATIKSAQEVLLVRDLNPGKFWLETERILMAAPSEGFARAALTTYQINKNAFYRVLQIRLAENGYQPGPVDGLLGRRTITALNRFCRDNDIEEICTTGPQRYSTVKVVANRLAELTAEPPALSANVDPQ